jgi:hypothetical protein
MRNYIYMMGAIIGISMCLAPSAYAQTAYDARSGGSVIIGYDSGVCDSGMEGAMRYYSSSSAGASIEYCDGTDWTNVIDYSTSSSSGANDVSADFSAGGGVRIGDDNRVCDSSIAGAVRYSGGGGVSSSNLIAHWTMDDTGGSTVVDELGNNDGEWTDGTDNVITTEDIAGQVDGALDFDDADNALVTIPTSTTTDLDNLTTMTVCGWFYVDNVPGSAGQLVGRTGGASFGDQSWSLGVTDAGGQVLTFRNRMRDVAYSTVALTYDAWEYVCATWDGTNGWGSMEIYLNGASVTDTGGDTGAGTVDDSGLDIEIAQDDSSSTYTDMAADDIRIYDVVLTPAQILGLYDGVGGPTSDTETGLTNHFTLDETTLTGGSTVADSVGSNDGTVTGTLTSVAGMDGTAINFDANSEYVDFGNISTIENQSEFTVSAWMKRNSSNAKVLVGTSSGTDGVYIDFWNDSRAYFAMSNASGFDEGSIVLNDTDWHLMTLVYDGSLSGNANRLKGFIDGTQVPLSFSGTVGATSPAGTLDFNIGTWPSQGEHSRGSVDDIRVYSRALSNIDVAKLYLSYEGSIQFCNGSTWTTPTAP